MIWRVYLCVSYIFDDLWKGNESLISCKTGLNACRKCKENVMFCDLFVSLAYLRKLELINITIIIIWSLRLYCLEGLVKWIIIKYTKFISTVI